MSPEELKIRARRLIEEVLNQGDLAVANELMSPTCVHHVPGTELGPGPASLRDWLSRTLRIFPDFHAIVEDEFAAGDRAALRITAYGTHAATGRPVEFSVLHYRSRIGPRPLRRALVRGRLLAVLGHSSTPVPALAAGDLVVTTVQDPHRTRSPGSGLCRPARPGPGMKASPLARAVTAALAATVLVALAGLVLTGLGWSHLATSDAIGSVGAAAGAIAYAALGALIVRRAGNLVGWFMLAEGAATAVMIDRLGLRDLRHEGAPRNAPGGGRGRGAGRVPSSCS